VAGKDFRNLAFQFIFSATYRERTAFGGLFLLKELDSIASSFPKGSGALISKLHHCGFDGKSGADFDEHVYLTSHLNLSLILSCSAANKRRPIFGLSVGLITKELIYHLF